MRPFKQATLELFRQKDAVDKLSQAYRIYNIQISMLEK